MMTKMVTMMRTIMMVVMMMRVKTVGGGTKMMMVVMRLAVTRMLKMSIGVGEGFGWCGPESSAESRLSVVLL